MAQKVHLVQIGALYSDPSYAFRTSFILISDIHFVDNYDLKEDCADALNHDWNISAVGSEEATGNDIWMMAKINKKPSNNNKYLQHN